MRSSARIFYASFKDVYTFIEYLEITIKHIKRGVKEVGKALRK